MLIKIVLVAAVYAVTLKFSGKVVRHFLNQVDPRLDNAPPVVGAIIGKCENIIAVTCVLANELTGLSLIFAAKALVRKTPDNRQDDYFLCGTLVNLVWSLAMGYLARWIWLA